MIFKKINNIIKFFTKPKPNFKFKKENNLF